MKMALCCKLHKVRFSKILNLSLDFRRFFLSESYRCNDVWTRRLQAPLLQKFDFNELASRMYEKHEQQGITSVVDMQILTAKMDQLTMSNIELMEKIMFQYRHSKTYNPVDDSIVEAVVRAYINLDTAERLLPLIKDKFNYGLIPDSYTASLLMDYFIKKGSISEAAHIAYEMMLQEDFSNNVTYLLSLYACCKRLESLSDLTAEETDGTEEEEIIWKRVKIVDHPHYDDHFDIKDERHLLGKTLYMLGKQTENGLLSRTLQLLGLGLWNKFPRAINMLENWMSTQNQVPRVVKMFESLTSAQDNKDIVMEEQLTMFAELLEGAPTRDPEAQEKDFYLRTLDDEIAKLNLTPNHKTAYLETFENLKGKLTSEKRISSQKLQEVVEKLVKQEILKHESSDIKSHQEQIMRYMTDTDKAYENQVKEYERSQVEQDIVNKLVSLAEKEEVLSAFEDRKEMVLAKLRKKEETIYKGEKVIDIDEEADKKKKSFIKKKK